MILASVTLFQQLNPCLLPAVHTISSIIYDFLGGWKESLLLHQMVVITKVHLIVFKEQLLVKGSESETAIFIFPLFSTLKTQGPYMVIFIEAKRPGMFPQNDTQSPPVQEPFLPPK